MYNPTFFPPTFPAGLSSDGPSALEVAVSNLSRQTREAALRQAHQRRTAGMSAIRSQHQGVLVIGALMPLQIAPALEVQVGAGFVAGGSHEENPLGTIDRMGYGSPLEIAVIGDALSVGRYGMGAVGNRANGYFAGGSDGADVVPLDDIDELSYSSQMMRVLGVALSVPKVYLAGVGTRANGYFAGGSTHGGSVPLNGIDEINYGSGPSVRGIGAVLFVGRYGLAAVGNSSHGYVGSGSVHTHFYYSLDKLIYRDKSVQVLGTNLSRRSHYSTAGNSSSGYFAGDYFTYTEASTIDRLTYADESLAAVGMNLSVQRYAAAATGDSTRGYWAGGVSAGGHLNSVEQLTYADETTAMEGATLSVSRWKPAAVGGYAGGIA